jgi:CheY-like chemotaxis protein
MDTLVVTAEDGRQALARLSSIQHVCLVLIDLLMPGMNGWDLIQELESRPELAGVAIVVYSSVANRAPNGATRCAPEALDIRRATLDRARVLRGVMAISACSGQLEAGLAGPDPLLTATELHRPLRVRAARVRVMQSDRGR